MMTTPPIPSGLSLVNFGELLWGVGPDGAQRRLHEVTRDELVQLGLTGEIAKLWLEFYQMQADRRRGLPASAVRVALLSKCLELLNSPEQPE